MVTYIGANSNVFGIVKEVKFYRKSAAKIPLKYGIRFTDHRKQLNN